MSKETLLRDSKIVEAYTAAETEILGELAAGYKADPALPGITRIRNRAVELAASLDEVTPAMVVEELSKLSVQGSSDALLQALMPDATVPTAPAVALIAGELVDELRSASKGILRTTDDIYRATVQSSVATGLARGETIRAGRDRVLQALAGKGVTGFTDRAGRVWNMTTYAEMAVRTAKLRAYRQQHTATLRSVGVSLVMVHGGNGLCDLCAPWVNKVLSLDGLGAGTRTVENQLGKLQQVEVAGTIDDAIAAGLEHPNCRCTRVAYLPGVTRPAEPRYNAELDAARDTLRGHEREIRRLKREKMFSDNPSRENKGIRRAQRRIRELTKATGIRRDRSREQIN